tara:strand:- start:5782 stop:6642 length:861 start_codon:yes stop_codon:yes gene_type:complete
MSIPGLSDGADPSGTTFGTQFTREAPQIEARKLQLMDTASGFAKDPVTIPGQQVSSFTGLQNEAIDRTQQGLGTFQPYLNQASNYLMDSTQAYDPNSYQAYMNPYQNEVIGGIERQFDKMQNQADMSAVQAGAFGGSRSGIQTAELGAQRAQTVGQAQAQNYGQAQQQAQQQFSNQMSRQQSAAQGIAGLGAQQQALQQGDIASAMSAGSVQQQQAQQISDAQYRQQLQQLYEPYQRLGFVSDIYQGMPSSGMSTTMGTSPMTNPLAQAVGTGITGLAGYQALKGS